MNINAQIESLLFNRSVEQIGDRWFWVGQAGELPGSPYVLPDGREAHAVRSFTTDPLRIGDVEREIDRRGLQDRYVWCMAEILWPGFTAAQKLNDAAPFEIWGKDVWELLRATPEQRCLAALRAVGVDVP